MTNIISALRQEFHCSASRSLPWGAHAPSRVAVGALADGLRPLHRELVRCQDGVGGGADPDMRGACAPQQRDPSTRVRIWGVPRQTGVPAQAGFQSSCVKGLIQGSGGGILLDRDGRKPFRVVHLAILIVKLNLCCGQEIHGFLVKRRILGGFSWRFYRQEP